MSDAGRVLQVLTERHYPMTIDVVAREARLSRRETEAAIEALRLEGQPIVSTGIRGVKLTRDPVELDAYLKQRSHRAVAIHLGTMAMRSTLQRLQDEARQVERPGFWDNGPVAA